MSTTRTFTVGDLVVCSASFVDDDGEAIDPSEVGFKVKDPSGNVTSYVYGDDIELVNDGTGEYHVDVNADEAGTWNYRFYSTGTGQAAEESTFTVETSQF